MTWPTLHVDPSQVRVGDVVVADGRLGMVIAHGHEYGLNVAVPHGGGGIVPWESVTAHWRQTALPADAETVDEALDLAVDADVAARRARAQADALRARAHELLDSEIPDAAARLRRRTMLLAGDVDASTAVELPLEDGRRVLVAIDRVTVLTATRVAEDAEVLAVAQTGDWTVQEIADYGTAGVSASPPTAATEPLLADVDARLRDAVLAAHRPPADPAVAVAAVAAAVAAAETFSDLLWAMISANATPEHVAQAGEQQTWASVGGFGDASIQIAAADGHDIWQADERGHWRHISSRRDHAGRWVSDGPQPVSDTDAPTVARRVLPILRAARETTDQTTRTD